MFPQLIAVTVMIFRHLKDSDFDLRHCMACWISGFFDWGLGKGKKENFHKHYVFFQSRRRSPSERIMITKWWIWQLRAVKIFRSEVRN